MESAQTRRDPPRTPPGAPGEGARIFPPIALAACVCLLGAVIGIALTLVKLVSDYSCRRSVFTVCEDGPALSCERAFNSAWGTFAGVPTTVWATAFYVAAFALCAAVLKRPSQAARWQLLGLAAIVDLAATGAMIGYSSMVLHVLCLYCTSLYLTSFLFAALVYAGHRRHSMPPSEPRAWSDLLGELFVPACLFVVTVAGQAFVYDRARLRGWAEVDCQTSIAPLPDTSLREPATDARWILAEFVDPTCSHCRNQFTKLRDLVREPSVAGQIELRYYHFPRDGAERCTPTNSHVLSDVAMANKACLAALAAQCMEKLEVGRGVEMLDRLFALQGGPSPWFSYATIETVARSMGAAPEPLLACVRTDGSVSAIVQKHVRYGAFVGVRKTPRLFLIPVRDGAPVYEDAQTVEGDKDLLLLRHLLGLASKE